MAKSEQFGFGGFFVRWIAALILVAAIYNPSGLSYVDWWVSDQGLVSLRVLVGLVLAAAVIVYLRATFRSINAFGVLLVTALLGALVWLLTDLGWLDLANEQVMTWVVLVIMATVMAVGLSWSHVRRRLSGQIDTDDVEQ